MTAITFESVFSQAQQLAPNERARLLAALSNDLRQPTQTKPSTRAERAAALDAVCGKYADVKTSVDGFLARKREEVELEEARYLARHPEEAT
ncbi:MAG: hypothetical protein ACRD82_07820 [Blastocatellia bacterium]